LIFHYNNFSRCCSAR